jgi:hypothetical protein
VTSDDLSGVADQNRVGEAEALDAVGDLPQLPLRVGAGIAGVGSQRTDCHHLDGWGGRVLHVESPLLEMGGELD